MRFLFTCGGTAGHINPAIGVAGRLKELLPDAEFLFIGAQGRSWCPERVMPSVPLKLTISAEA